MRTRGPGRSRQHFFGSYKQAPGLAEHLLSVPAKSHLPVKPDFQAYRLPPNWPSPTGLAPFSALMCFSFSMSQRHQEADVNSLIKYAHRSGVSKALAARVAPCYVPRSTVNSASGYR